MRFPILTSSGYIDILFVLASSGDFPRPLGGVMITNSGSVGFSDSDLPRSSFTMKCVGTTSPHLNGADRPEKKVIPSAGAL